MARILIALGGNALGNNYIEQQKLLARAAKGLYKLCKGNELIITHGNGPQVGMITKALAGDGIDMPLDCCTAMSEGYIGFHIQRKLKYELLKHNVDRDVATIVTEVLVNKSDRSFNNPSKPIGKFYTKEEAEVLMKKSHDPYIEDAGRGYRKVVASPKPVGIGNVRVIENLVSNGTIVVACGGGGVPVFRDYDNKKVEAVIDKDLASSLLAQKLNVDKFIILTAVQQVYIHGDTPKKKYLNEISVSEAMKYMGRDEFKRGSMLPKIEAAIDYVNNTGKEAIITSLDNIKGILNNTNITVIKKDK